MFTGLISAVGTVRSLAEAGGGRRLVIDPAGWDHAPAAGHSIAVSGCCLTHAPADHDPAGILAFDVVAETLAKTKLGQLETGSRVNLEACLRPADRIGGHFVQGHVDGLGEVRRVQTGEGEHCVTIGVDGELMRCIAPTGSIAVDGVSLTVAGVDVERGSFDVALVPTTLRETTLGELREGEPVNVELDVLARTVVHYLRHFGRADGLAEMTRNWLGTGY